MKYLARLLPEHLKVHEDVVGVTLPLIREHQVYTPAIGSVTVLENNLGVLESDEISVGDKLSAGSFLMEEGKHYLREVSVVENPKYPECGVLEVYNDKSNDI